MLTYRARSIQEKREKHCYKRSIFRDGYIPGFRHFEVIEKINKIIIVRFTTSLPQLLSLKLQTALDADIIES